MRCQFSVLSAGIRPHQVMALHGMVSLCWIGAGAMAHRLRPDLPWGQGLAIMGMMLLILMLIRNRWIRRSRVNGILRLAESGVMGCFAVFAGFQGWWPAMLTLGVMTLVLVFAYRQEQPGHKPSRHILISESGVRIPGKWGGRLLEWPEIENLIYRHGVFTLNLRDGRLHQFEVQPPSEDWSQVEPQCRKWIKNSQNQKNSN